MKRCLYCYQLLTEDEIDFHPACSRKFFGDPVPPLMKYTEAQIEGLAYQLIQNRSTITGVQPKIALGLTATNSKEPKRFTIVGLSGGYILKPPGPQYQHQPQIEDLTMHLAEIAGIKVVPHSLIRLQSGNLAFITKRIDRTKKNKLHMEDMCQLTGRLTEDKYQGSYEEIAQAIMKYSIHPGLDVVNFCEQVLFSFLTGNADMHLKKVSLIKQPGTGYVLSPAYGLVATALVHTQDSEEMALSLNGKKSKMMRGDFDNFFRTVGLNAKQLENIYKKMKMAASKWMEFIEISFLTAEMKKRYQELIENRLDLAK